MTPVTNFDFLLLSYCFVYIMYVIFFINNQILGVIFKFYENQCFIMTYFFVKLCI